MVISSCSAYQTIPIQYSRIPIQPSKNRADTIVRMLKNYRKTLTDSLEKIIAFSNHPWFNKAPDYAMANLLADGIWNTVSKQDSSVVGVLLSTTGLQGYWPRGNITTFQLYQLVPENRIWGTISLQGSKLLSVCVQLMEQGGWTISQNMQIVKRSNQEFVITLSGMPLRMDALYNIVIVSSEVYSCGKERDLPVDFHWGKGDLRDMLLDYCMLFSQQGKPLPLLQEKRLYAGDY